mgnify:CR=1 FL=1
MDRRPRREVAFDDAPKRGRGRYGDWEPLPRQGVPIQSTRNTDNTGRAPPRGRPRGGSKKWVPHTLQVGNRGFLPKLVETRMGISSDIVLRDTREGLKRCLGTGNCEIRRRYLKRITAYTRTIHYMDIGMCLDGRKPVKRVLTLDMASFAAPLGLLSHTTTIFNTTPYIQLLYATLTILFKALATLIITTSMELILTHAAYASN